MQKLRALLLSVGIVCCIAAPLGCRDNPALTGGASHGGAGQDAGGGGSSDGAGPQGGAADGGGGAVQGGSPQGGAPAGGSGPGGSGEGGQGGAGSSTASEQIAAVIATPDGGGLTLPIDGALVTYLKPTLGQDLAGFFLQAEQAGPAIFVAVDPATLTPPPVVGDEVDLTVTDVVTTTGLKQVTGVSGFSVASSGNSIDPLVTDVSAAADLVSSLSSYESRVISFDADIVAAFTSAGNPQVAAEISTAGLTDSNLRLRMPETVRALSDLQLGCIVEVNYGVMWRFNTTAQPSTLQASDITGVACPDPTVVSAVATDATHVSVTFSRAIDPASVLANGSQFTFNGGLTASAASVSGNTATVTTSTQTNGFAYTLTVDNTVEDVIGATLGTPDQASFTGFGVAAGQCLDGSTLRPIVQPTAGQLVISELMPDPSLVTDANGEWFEVRSLAPAPFDLNGLQAGTTTLGATPIVPLSGNCVTLNPNAFALFARNATTATNGMLPAVDGTVTFTLTNASGTLTIGVGGVTLDSKTWTASSAGKSIMIDSDGTQCTSPAGVPLYNGTDTGTPRAINTPPECP